MSTNGIKETETIDKRLKKIAGVSGKIVLTVGILYVGIDWLKRSLEERKGCWLITTVNGKSTSCRMSRHMCSKITLSSTAPCVNENTFDIYNAVVFLINTFNRPTDDNLLKGLLIALNIEVLPSTDEIPNIIKTKFDVLDTFTKEHLNEMKTMNLCAHDLGVESNKIPYCRMCDPQALPSNTTFVNTDGLSSNMTFHGVEDPNVLDLLSDVVTSTGKNIFDNVFSFGWSILKYGVWLLLALVIIAVYVFFYKKIFKMSVASIGSSRDL